MTQHTFRRATPADLDLIISIARQAYPQVTDWEAGRRWAAAMLANQGSVMCLIGQRSVGFMMVMHAFWDAAPRAFLLPLFSIPGSDLEPLAMVRQFAAFAKQVGCATLQAGTETASDVGILLKRLGGAPRELYELEL